MIKKDATAPNAAPQAMHNGTGAPRDWFLAPKTVPNPVAQAAVQPRKRPIPLNCSLNAAESWGLNKIARPRIPRSTPILFCLDSGFDKTIALTTAATTAEIESRIALTPLGI